MAAIASETVNITVNDIPLQVPKGELVVESVKRLGLEVPIFCYHPRMKPVGMCRMCLVDVGFKQPDGSVRKMPKPQTACTLPASEGMVVFTDTEQIHRDRKGVLEFLLINHPLDCPICDRGGECPLQNNTLFYGPSTSRYVEIKRHLPKAYPLSKYVTLDLERCIQCGRCVRFTEEISGDSELAFRFRGASMQPSTFELRDFTSKFSGNVIEICPVGALTSSQYRFRARPWDLETKPGICTECSNGCNIWFDYRVGKMVRINGRTNESVNEEWTCDKGKFGHDWYNSDKRLTRVLIRKGEQLVAGDWAEAYGQIISQFVDGGRQVGVLGGAKLSNEAQFLLQRLVRGHFRSPNLDHRFTQFLQAAEDRLEIKAQMAQVQTPIAHLEELDSLLAFGTSLADEQPILFLRARKAWFKNGARIVVAHHAPTDLDPFAHLILRYHPGTHLALAKALRAAALEAGLLTASDAVKESLKGFSPEEAESITGVKAVLIREAAKLLGANSAWITTQGLFNLPDAQKTLETLAGWAAAVKGQFNCYALEANAQGAEELGLLPDLLPGKVVANADQKGWNTHQMLQAAAEGKLRALWLVDVDPFQAHPDRDLVTRALENVEFLVVQSTLENEAVPYASVVLPMAAPAEQEGTYTNMERRVQHFEPILALKGDAKPGWKIVQELTLRIRPEKPFFHAHEVMEAIQASVPAFREVSFTGLVRSEGHLLG